MARWFWSVIWDGVDPKVDITDPITVKCIRTLVIVIAHTYRLLAVERTQTEAKAEGTIVTRDTLGYKGDSITHLQTQWANSKHLTYLGGELKKNILQAESEVTQETDRGINGKV